MEQRTPEQRETAFILRRELFFQKMVEKRRERLKMEKKRGKHLNGDFSTADCCSLHTKGGSKCYKKSLEKEEADRGLFN